MSHPDLIIANQKHVPGTPRRAGNPLVTLGEEVLKAVREHLTDDVPRHEYIGRVAVTTARALDLIE